MELIKNLKVDGEPVEMILGQRGKPQIIHNGYTYCCAKLIRGRGYWVCSKEKSRRCRARYISDKNSGIFYVKNPTHTHDPEFDKQQMNILIDDF